MADVTTESAKWQYTFNLKRDDEETTRVFSIDNPISGAAGVSAAKAFRDVFTGAASSPFSVIDPTQFIQPTGWRDEDPEEAPWTTTAVYLKRIDTTETAYDGGGGGGGDEGRNLTLTYEPESVGGILIQFNGTGTPKAFDDSGVVQVSRDTSQGYYFIERTSGTYYVIIPEDETYSTAAAQITV